MKRIRTLDAVALWIGRVVLAILGWLLLMQIVVRLVRRRWRFPAPALVSLLLDSPLRRAIQKPEVVLGRIGMRPGMSVLELGCGPGTFTIEAARRVLPDGRVVAVDIQPAMLARLRARAVQMGTSNLDIYRADAYHLPVADSSVDLAYAVTVLAEIPDRPRALAELQRVLKPGGVLSVSELLIDPDYPLQRTVIRWCADAGFIHEACYGGLLEYTLVFRKPDM